MSARPHIWLASASPRRKQLLERAGYECSIHLPGVNDGVLSAGRISETEWVMALAYLKAANVARREPNFAEAKNAILLGADTVCVHEGRILGQPRGAEHAREMLRAMRGAEHEVLTGACILTPPRLRRFLFSDSAKVTIGDLPDAAIEKYLASGLWRGKAGAYNLEDRVEGGWPISYVGDPATIMGLPMQKLPMWISQAMEGAAGANAGRSGL